MASLIDLSLLLPRHNEIIKELDFIVLEAHSGIHGTIITGYWPEFDSYSWKEGYRYSHSSLVRLNEIAAIDGIRWFELPDHHMFAHIGLEGWLS